MSQLAEKETYSPIYAIGLMSGTSLDGVDAALLLTDGVRVLDYGPSLTIPYPSNLKRQLLDLHHIVDYLSLERDVTEIHVQAVHKLLEKSKMEAHKVHVVGFHGQTLYHDPAQGMTWQIGNPALLAEKTEISVVSDFRRRDIAAGGQGAPLVPIFHQAILSNIPKPVAIVNIGGIANVTWVGNDDELVAFDVGPGNALLDDWVRQHHQGDYDPSGKHAALGKIHSGVCDDYLSHSFFASPPPKSLDRASFCLDPVKNLSFEDGAATLSMVTAKGIVHASQFFPDAVWSWYVAGGGRHNMTLMLYLKELLGGAVQAIETLGQDGDALEAQAFAFLAVRSLYKLPITLPSTTGAIRAVTGGAFYHA